MKVESGPKVKLLDYAHLGVWPLREISGLQRLKIFRIEVCSNETMSGGAPKER